MTETQHRQGPRPDQLVGTWYRADTQPEPNKRIGFDPNHLMFHLWEGDLGWSGSDGVNTTSGRVQLGDDGAFRTFGNGTTLVGRFPGPSPTEELTITILKSAVRVSLDEGRLTLYNHEGPSGAFYQCAPTAVYGRPPRPVS